MSTLTDLFIGDPKWRRPTPGANRCVILAGTSCCICVPSNATRVVVEMWGQGGGGAGAACCSWGCSGGQGGSYGAKVWEGSQAPASTNCCIMFCGCVCACDCRAPGCTGQSCGHPGQFSRLTSCSTGNPTVGGWIGCVNGGAGGCRGGIGTSWPCCGCKCNPGYDIQCIGVGATNLPEAYQIAFMSTAQSSACDGGSQSCCAGASCYCATGYCSATCTGFQHRFNETCIVPSANSSALFSFDQIFPKINCSCFDNYRLGACGWSKAGNPYLTSCTIWNWCDIGVGGAAYAGGCQQKQNFSMGSWASCGFAGNFPGGGGKSAGACGGPCCCGSIGGAGVILVSWNT